MSNTVEFDIDHLTREVSKTARPTSAHARRRIGEAFRHARDATARAGARARDLYGEVTGRARRIAGTVDPYVKGNPYATMGFVAGASLLLGLIAAGRGPKVIYVEPKG